MARKSGLPRWLAVLLTVVAIVVLGPPAIALLLMALGIATGVAAGALKLAIIGLGIYALVMLVQALVGKSKSPRGQIQSDSLQHSVEYVDRMDAERRALDDELARAVAATQK